MVLFTEGLYLKEEEKKQFLEDFKKADIDKKLDMWYFAAEQAGIWEEIINEISTIAQAQNPTRGGADDE